MCYGNLNTNYYFGFEVLTVVGIETAIVLHLSLAAVVTVNTHGKWEQRQNFISSNYNGVFHTGCVVDSRFFNFVNN